MHLFTNVSQPDRLDTGRQLTLEAILSRPVTDKKCSIKNHATLTEDIKILTIQFSFLFSRRRGRGRCRRRRRRRNRIVRPTNGPLRILLKDRRSTSRPNEYAGELLANYFEFTMRGGLRMEFKRARSRPWAEAVSGWVPESWLEG